MALNSLPFHISLNPTTVNLVSSNRQLQVFQYIHTAVPRTTNSSVSFASNPRKAKYLQFRSALFSFLLWPQFQPYYSAMMLIWLKAIKTDNKRNRRKYEKRPCTNCNHVQLVGTLTTCAAAVSLDESLQHFDIQEETGTGNVHWLGDAGIHLTHPPPNKPEQKSSSWLDLFWPRADQSRAQKDPDKFPG